jgi:MoxR-like ATPase
MATQNPLEHEGTYPLPEAQIDRFMFKALVTYPSRADEAKIVDRISINEPTPPVATLSMEELTAAQEIIGSIHLDDRIRDYLLDIVAATRNPAAFGLQELAPLIDHGVSPRGSIFLARAARARAFLQQRGYVVPDDILTVAPLVLRHRLLLSYEADVEGAVADELLQRIFDTVSAP